MKDLERDRTFFEPKIGFDLGQQKLDAIIMFEDVLSLTVMRACQKVFKEIKWPWHAKNGAAFYPNLGPVHCGKCKHDQSLGMNLHTPFTFGIGH